MRRLLAIGGCWLALFVCAGFAETLPPKPAAYFNDYAHVVSPATASTLDEELRQFERDSSNQIVVAVFPKLETESSVQDFTYRIAESWKVGQKDRNNGAVLFVFIAEHKMFIQVGYGLEGALPDATCKRIIADEIAPAFKAGKYDAGLIAGVESMIKATRGEYQGTGKTAGDAASAHIPAGAFVMLAFVLLLIVMQVVQSWRSAAVYSRNGRSFLAGFLLNFALNMFSSSGSSGRGSSGGSSGGGGFSGGGGSFGGGGAGGDW